MAKTRAEPITLSNDGLEIPPEQFGEVLSILAMRGAGKTYTGKKIVEGYLANHWPVVIMDPTGVWWGLKSSADGKREGFPVVVFGGDHADVEIEDTDGKAVARAIVEQNISAIIDLSAFGARAKERRFATGFLAELIARNKTPRHVVFDEADLFAPQQPGNDATTLLGHVEYIALRGRVKGLGMTLITQRAARINKNVLNQSSAYLFMRVTGRQDLDEIEKVLRMEFSAKEAKAIRSKITKFAQGDGLWWSPQREGEPSTIRVAPIGTFDSSATPKLGEVIATPDRIYSPDLEAMAAALTAAREKVETKKAAKHAPASEGSSEEIESLRLNVQALTAERDQAIADIREITEFLGQIIRKHAPPVIVLKNKDVPEPPAPPAKPAPAPSDEEGDGTSDDLTPAAKRVLAAIHYWAERLVRDPSFSQVALIAGLSVTSSHLPLKLMELRDAGLVGRGCRMTEEGERYIEQNGLALGGSPQTAWAAADRLIESRKDLSSSCSTLIREMKERGRVTTQEAADIMGLSRNSSHTPALLGTLKKQGLILQPSRGQWKLTEALR